MNSVLKYNIKKKKKKVFSLLKRTHQSMQKIPVL